MAEEVVELVLDGTSLWVHQEDALGEVGGEAVEVSAEEEA